MKQIKATTRTEIQRAQEIFNDASFREALMNEGSYQEQVDRYGMKPIGYLHWVWLGAYSQARYETAAIEAQAADGPYGRIV